MSRDDDEFLVHQEIERNQGLKEKIKHAARHKNKAYIKQIVENILSKYGRVTTNVSSIVNKIIEWYKDTFA